MTEESFFLREADSQDLRQWDASAVARISRLQVPDAILGAQKKIVRADVYRQWAGWFVESFCDPRRYAHNGLGYPEIYQDVWKSVSQRLPTWTHSQRSELTKCTAQSIYNRVKKIQTSKTRPKADTAVKRLLLDFAGSPPRCWICGAEFSDAAIEQFSGGATETAPLPPFVDVFKPRGLASADIEIQIDHREPFHAGGDDDDNLALACGFCNRYKSGDTSIYDVPGHTREPGKMIGSVYSLPQLFWVIRLLALVGHCEYAEGCNKTKSNSELTVSPICLNGSLNPSNLEVTCYHHDKLQDERLMRRRDVSQLWGLGRS